MISVYSRQTEIEVTNRRLEQMARYNKIIQYGRQNPVWFVENIFKVTLLDFQRYIFMGAWPADTVVLVCSRNSGKTFWAALYMMTRALLFPYYQINLLNVSARQSQDTFLKMENIAKKQIASLVGSSDVFYNEVVRATTGGDGFLHREQSYFCQLYNGSTITSLVGVAKNIVGKRSNLNIYDEAGKISRELFTLTEPFTTQDVDFKTGADVDLTVVPNSLPNQCVYMSSAEDVTSYLYTKYKDCARSMAMGRKDKFAVDINCEIPMKPTLNGKPYAPLLKRSVVEAAMRVDEAKALREYYNLFDVTGGVDAAITRDVITRNEYRYLPVLGSEHKEGVHYGIFYDPALQRDNSIILVAEYWRDPEKGWLCRLINCQNLLERLPNNEKKLLMTTEQLDILRDYMVKYNGNAPDYDNLYVFIDPGSGGGGRHYADYLLEDWTDSRGVPHRGVIDMDDESYKKIAYKFPRAVPGVLQLLEASKYKSIMFGEGLEMVYQDLVMFPPPPPGSGMLQLDDREVQLSPDEMRALVELDLAKEELVAIRKTKSGNGKIKYDLPVSKDATPVRHDDRAYVCAAAFYHLSQLRRDDQIESKSGVAVDLSAIYNRRLAQQQGAPKIPVGGGGVTKRGPFSGRANPFAGKSPFSRR